MALTIIKMKYIILLYTLLSTAVGGDYVLMNVFMLSRHNLRTPLAKNLVQLTPNIWPSWDNNEGEVTAKGILLERYISQHIISWLNNERLFNKRECPKNGSVVIYANSLQRTIVSAQAFADAGFPGCLVTANYIYEIGTMDPLFDPAITNTSSEFQEEALRVITDRETSLKLYDSYNELQNILNFENSEICRKEYQCNLVTDRNLFSVSPGAKPSVYGPLKVASSVADAFLMQFYKGIPITDIAWGKISTKSQWTQFIKIKEIYQELLFYTPIVAENIAKPLRIYINNLINESDMPKLTLLVGHDSNIGSLLKSMNFEQYKLPMQLEMTPIGGKVVFQKWVYNDEAFLKVEYIYFTMEQIRNGSKLSVTDPPQRVQLKLQDCQHNTQGFCPWNEFKRILATMV